MAEPLLRVENLVRRFGGVLATDNVSLDVAKRRTARNHRPERRRQDHADQPAHRTVVAAFRQHPLCRSGHHRACRPSAAARSGWRARSRSPRCCRTSPRRTMSRWRRRRMTGTPSASGAMPARKSALRDAARSALERVGLEHRADVVVSEAEPWRAARARTRGRARHQAAIAAARRADGRDWASRNPRAW